MDEETRPTVRPIVIMQGERLSILNEDGRLVASIVDDTWSNEIEIFRQNAQLTVWSDGAEVDLMGDVDRITATTENQHLLSSGDF